MYIFSRHFNTNRLMLVSASLEKWTKTDQNIKYLGAIIVHRPGFHKQDAQELVLHFLDTEKKWLKERVFVPGFFSRFFLRLTACAGNARSKIGVTPRYSASTPSSRNNTLTTSRIPLGYLPCGAKEGTKPVTIQQLLKTSCMINYIRHVTREHVPCRGRSNAKECKQENKWSYKMHHI